MDKKTVIFLPYFKLTGKESTIAGIVIKEYPFEELEKFNVINDILTVGEYNRILEKRKGIKKTSPMETQSFSSEKYVVLELPKDDDIDLSFCYVALLDLLTNHWRYLLKNNGAYSKRTFISLTTPFYERENDAPLYSLTNALVRKLESGIKLVRNNKRLQIGLRRWRTTYTDRSDHLDIILDCCSSLESLFDLEGELRLRLSLYVYHFLRKKRKKVLSQVYSIYGIRNDFIHGSKIPTVNDTKDAIILVREVLSTIIEKNQLPNSEVLIKQIGLINKEK